MNSYFVKFAVADRCLGIYLKFICTLCAWEVYRDTFNLLFPKRKTLKYSESMQQRLICL